MLTEAQTGARRAWILAKLSHEIVIVFACADPKPDDEIAMFLCHSAIVIADSHGPNVPDKQLKLH